MTERTDDTAGSTAGEQPEATILGKGDWAVVWSAAEGFSLMMPKIGDDDIIPAPAVALLGAGTGLTTDAAFFEMCHARFANLTETPADDEGLQERIALGAELLNAHQES